jgi:uncharacterized RDD family membrane protein YckC
MRCPKCHYVSFDGQSRCRNCGYDFSLAAPEPIDLSTRQENPATPLADLSLKPDEPAGLSGNVPDTFAPTPAAGGAAGAARARTPETDPLDLPLFEPRPRPGASRDPIDRPLVSGSAPPRPPLAVRRPTGDPPRARQRVTPTSSPHTKEPRLELDMSDRGSEGLDRLSRESDRVHGDADRLTPEAKGIPRESDPLARQSGHAPIDPRRGSGYTAASHPATIGDEPITAADRDVSIQTAGRAAIDASMAPLGARAVAALVDLAFLAAVDATVLYFTLRLTGVPFADLDRLPLMPLLGFLALVNGGYLTMFIAASGQTMGKMLAGVRVVSMDHGTVPFGHAVLRAILWLLTIVPFGIGAIPALMTDDRRALHDRLANTRVVKEG